jgi:modulator of FtsH protease HflC
MKNVWILIFVLLIAAVLVLYLVSFQVRETESAIVTRFEKPRGSAITVPGLYWKWPAPIETVHKFDSRMKVFEGVLEETQTKGGNPITVVSYVVWKVGDPMKMFSQKVDVETTLMGILREKQNAVIGQHAFDEFVNPDPTKIKFDQIEKELTDAIAATANEKYGISIESVGIKQLKVSEDNTKKAFEGMRAERKSKATAIRREGEALAKKITSDAESKKTELLAAAEARAKQIRGQGDAEAAQYYKMLETDPEFAMFLRDIDALKVMFKERTTMVFTTNTEPFSLLREMPKLTPKAEQPSK